jgi:hypothetical protein
VKAQNYPEAYRLWGCTKEKPCRDYSYESFLRDFSGVGEFHNIGLRLPGKVRHCEAGIIQSFQYPGEEAVYLYVDSDRDAISFAPWQEHCNPKIPVGTLRGQ